MNWKWEFRKWGSEEKRDSKENVKSERGSVNTKTVSAPESGPACVWWPMTSAVTISCVTQDLSWWESGQLAESDIKCELEQHCYTVCEMSNKRSLFSDRCLRNISFWVWQTKVALVLLLLFYLICWIWPYHIIYQAKHTLNLPDRIDTLGHWRFLLLKYVEQVLIEFGQLHS